MKQIWKLYKKSILSSMVVILILFCLIYVSVLQGKFLWFTDITPVGQAPTAYFVLEASVWLILFSFLALFILFIIFLSGKKFI